jgi:hypothetical protein
MALRHVDRVAGVVGVNTPHIARTPADPIELLRIRFGDTMYIVQFQDPAREPDRIFGSRVEQTFDVFMRKTDAARRSGIHRANDRRHRCFAKAEAGVSAGGRREPKLGPRERILSAEEERGVCRYLHAHRFHRRYQLVPQHVAQLAAFRGASITPCGYPR